MKGINFEKNFLHDMSMRLYCEKWFKAATEEEDLYEGTDIYFAGMRVDITTDFVGKDKMEILFGEGSSFILSEHVALDIGIRWGNTHLDFKEPVIVWGFSPERTGYLRWEFIKICDNFVEQIPDIAKWMKIRLDEWKIKNNIA